MTTTTKLDKVSETAKTLATTIRSELSFDGEGSGVLADDIFERTLPADVTLDTVKRVQNHTLDFANGLTLALGEAGIEHLNGHLDLASVNVRAKLGNDTVASEFHRTREGRNPATGETVVKYGAVSTKYTTGVGAGRGDYKRVQEHLSESAAAVFNK